MAILSNSGRNNYEEWGSVFSPGWKARANRERLANTLIVIIDDSVCVRKIVETTLRREGYATIGFAEGPTALRWLASEEGHLPALIILDVTMPKMDGYTVLHHLRKLAATAQTPVVMLSRHGGLLDRLKGRLAGVCVYLTKPFHQQTILSVVREQLAPPIAIISGTAGPRQPIASAPGHGAIRPIILRRMEG